MNTTTPSQRAAARLDAVAKWLRSPLARLVTPFPIRDAIRRLVNDAENALRQPYPVQLTVRPQLGARVRLIAYDTYLHRACNATPGSTGVVTSYSTLSPHDDGILVDWGNGRSIRCTLAELAAA